MKTYEEFVDRIYGMIDDDLDQFENSVIYDNKGTEEDLEKATKFSRKLERYIRRIK